MRENMIIHFPRNKEMIERRVHNNNLELSVESKSIKPRGQALMAKRGKGARKNKSSTKSVKAPKASSSSDKTCYICTQPGHVMKDRKAHIIAHPEQVREKESSMDDCAPSRKTRMRKMYRFVR